MSKIRILEKMFQRCPLSFLVFMGPRFSRKLTREPFEAAFSWKIRVKLEISIYNFLKSRSFIG